LRTIGERVSTVKPRGFKSWAHWANKRGLRGSSNSNVPRINRMVDELIVDEYARELAAFPDWSPLVTEYMRQKRYREWYEREGREYTAKQAKRYYHRRKGDPEFIVKHKLRRIISRMVRNRGMRKLRSSEGYLGCSFARARAHIEAQWLEGMNWGNHGTAWVIDHIIPLAAYDLTDEEQAMQASHYTNLQPLWAHENAEKSDRLDWVRQHTPESAPNEIYRNKESFSLAA
jgi:hypothetical protein